MSMTDPRPIVQQHLSDLALFSGRVSVVSDYWRSGRLTAEEGMKRVRELVKGLQVSKAYTKEGDLK